MFSLGALFRSGGLLICAAVLAAAQEGPPVPQDGPATAPSAPQAVPAPSPVLKWDQDTKEYKAKPGETHAEFKFKVTNISKAPVVIENVTTSCGCSVATMPAKPWSLAPREGGEIGVTVDLRGKQGMLFKTAVVYGSFGNKVLVMKMSIPAPAADTVSLSGASEKGAAANPNGDERLRNIQLAQADRQTVFKNDCASCHFKPAVGKTGDTLYQAACAICHESPHRASMVPDLAALPKTTSREYWVAWISHGKKGSLMPAFKESEGGPLTDAQIQNLADLLTAKFPGQQSVARQFKAE